MHLLLVDQMTCPRCGPEFSLILVADKIQVRRVLEGFLGCPNCREKFPIIDGYGDLRPSTCGGIRKAPHRATGKLPEALEMAALLGLTGGDGNVGLIGDLSDRIKDLIEITTNFEFVGIRHEILQEQGCSEETERENRLIVGQKLPFRNRCFRGLAVLGNPDVDWMLEIARTVDRDGRVVVWGGTNQLIGVLENEGLEILMKQKDVVIFGLS